MSMDDLVTDTTLKLECIPIVRNKAFFVLSLPGVLWTSSWSLRFFAYRCSLDQFLELGKGDGQVPELTFEQLTFNHPLFIMYSSGTTGVPKCMVHSVGVGISLNFPYTYVGTVVVVEQFLRLVQPLLNSPAVGSSGRRN